MRKGKCTNSSQYICFALHNGLWYKLDDDDVLVTTESIVLSEQVYFLMYEKAGALVPPTDAIAGAAAIAAMNAASAAEAAQNKACEHGCDGSSTVQDAQAALVAPPPRCRVREANGADGEEAPSKKRTTSAAGERKPKACHGSETRPFIWEFVGTEHSRPYPPAQKPCAMRPGPAPFQLLSCVSQSC